MSAQVTHNGTTPDACPGKTEDLFNIDGRLHPDNAELRARIDELERALQTKEMAMAKDRAELARQRNVILRLHQELNALVMESGAR
jgi:hypothetical protein